MRRSLLAPKTTPVLPYSLVPQHHGMSCVPKSEYLLATHDTHDVHSACVHL